MPKKRVNLRSKPKAIKTVKEKVKPINPPSGEMDGLRFYVAEAEKVELMSFTPGWVILERDLTTYKEQISEKLAYLDPDTKEYKDARILYIASDKILKIVNDYAENRRRALELLHKIDNTQDNIVLDVDN